MQTAKDVAGKTDVTLKELTDAKDNLQAAHDALVTPEGTVDKEKLKALVAVYKEILNAGQGSYSDESWKAFSDALTNAETLLANDKATQAEIDEAYSTLETARSNLTSTKNTEKLDALIEKAIIQMKAGKHFRMRSVQQRKYQAGQTQHRQKSTRQNRSTRRHHRQRKVKSPYCRVR